MRLTEDVEAGAEGTISTNTDTLAMSTVLVTVELGIGATRTMVNSSSRWNE